VHGTLTQLVEHGGLDTSAFKSVRGCILSAGSATVKTAAHWIEDGVEQTHRCLEIAEL
jgi:hypothetical protein